MSLKSLVLGSAVALAFATPGFAQQQDTGPQYSTPQEHAQTSNLNNQEVNGTNTSPATLNGEAPGTISEPVSSSDNDANDRDQQYQDNQQRYQQQMDQYRNQRDRYEDQRARYNASRSLYLRDVRRYDVRRYDYDDYPMPIEYRYDTRLVGLYLIANPSDQLYQAPVEGPSGAFIGKIRGVETGPDGRPDRVEVALNRHVSVWVMPAHLRYDPDDHVVFTDMTRADLWSMPGATYESGDFY